MRREGAELAFTYQNEKLKDRVIGFAEQWGSDLVYPCDVTEDSQIEDLMSGISDAWDGLDGIVHCLAFAPGSELDGNTSTLRHGPGSCWHMKSVPTVLLPSQRLAKSSCPVVRVPCLH